MSALKPDTSRADHSDSSAGLCAECRNARRIASDRGSIFYMCSLSATDPAFPKYPRLPVIECPGYEKAE